MTDLCLFDHLLLEMSKASPLMKLIVNIFNSLYYTPGIAFAFSCNKVRVSVNFFPSKVSQELLNLGF